MISSQEDLLLGSFTLLGLSPGATHQQVKAAYRDLIHVWHPDRFTHNDRLRAKSEKKLQEINAAYEILESYFAGGWKPPEPEPTQTDPLTAKLLKALTAKLLKVYSLITYRKAVVVGLVCLCLFLIIGLLRGRSQDDLNAIQGEWIYKRDSMACSIDKIELKVYGKKAQWTIYDVKGGQTTSKNIDIIRIESKQDGTKLAIIGQYDQEKTTYETSNVGLFLIGNEMEVAFLPQGKTLGQVTKDDIWRFQRTGH